jgi:hypothetical protein
MKKLFIYELVDPITNLPRYIGKAKNPQIRYSGHLNDKSLTYKSNWVQGLLSKGMKPILNIIDIVSEKEVNFWEMHYISLYRSWGFTLTNKTQGGDGGDLRSGSKNTPEHNKKILFSKTSEGQLLLIDKRKRNKESKTKRLSLPEVRKKAVGTRKKNSSYLSKETKLKIGLGNKGKVRSKELKQRISNTLKGRPSHQKGKKLSDEIKKRMSNSRKGKRHSQETLEKLKIANIKTGLKLRGRIPHNKGISNTVAMKPIILVETGQEFQSIKQAADFLKINSGGISEMLNGRLKTYKGYKFIFKEKK